ncbi:MAG TPA: hypothetical protein VFQ99_06210 [Gallionella sp.]|nr:hypothetical protein [Gallionella sp.]
MKQLVFTCSVCLSFAIGTMVFDAGKKAALRECPPAQHGERLLTSEQRANSTIYTYASGWNGYGRTIKERKP